jgi:hypothetical protein
MSVLPPDPNAVNAWVNLLTPLALAILTVTQFVIARLAAQKVNEVKRTLETNNAVQSDKMDVIAGAVNGAHGTALRVAANALERLAGLTKLDEDILAAKVARSASDAHAAIPSPSPGVKP